MVKVWPLAVVALLQLLAAIQLTQKGEWKLALANFFISCASMVYATIGKSE